MANQSGNGVPLGVLVIGRKRPGFDQEWNLIQRRKCVAAMEGLGYRCVGADAPVVDDQTIGERIDQIEAAGCGAMVVLQPSMGNGQLSMTVAQAWGGPVVLWATPERPDAAKVSSCSLVAQHMWGAIFRQARHPFEFVYGDADDTRVRTDLAKAIGVCRMARSLRRAKVGMVGSFAPGFIDMAADPPVMRQKLGVQLHPLSLLQFVDRVKAVNDAAVKDDVEKVRAMGLGMKGVTAEDLATSSRCYLGTKELIAEEQLDALSLQEWPELPNVLGQWPYLAMARLTDEGFPLSMEGDVDGAVSCLMGKLAGTGVGYITDWLEHDARGVFFWHAGMAPFQMLEGASLGKHFNIEKPLVVDGPMKVGQPITAMRLWRCDGHYWMTAFEGRTVKPSREMTGNTAQVEVKGVDVLRLFDDLIHAGLPHHVVLFYGQHADAFRRMARMIGATWVA